MILFLFSNVDPFVFKKPDHFISLAFEKRESRSLNIATQASRNEFESERARLSWADTSSPPPNLASLNSQTPLVGINGLSALSGLNLEKM